MAKLEKSLHALHEARSARPAPAQSTPSSSSSAAPLPVAPTAAGDSLVPIAKVNEVRMDGENATYVVVGHVPADGGKVRASLA